MRAEITEPACRLVHFSHVTTAPGNSRLTVPTKLAALALLAIITGPQW
jgi:hypothetical protein